MNFQMGDVVTEMKRLSKAAKERAKGANLINATKSINSMVRKLQGLKRKVACDLFRLLSSFPDEYFWIRLKKNSSPYSSDGGGPENREQVRGPVSGLFACHPSYSLDPENALEGTARSFE